METSSVLLLCILVTCSVWMVQGRCLEISNDDQQLNDLDVSMDASKLPGLCWACKWAMNKLKKFGGSNATEESLKPKVLGICDKIGLLKSLCRKFVRRHLGSIIEELTTTDDVRTICINLNACKPQLEDLAFYQSDEELLKFLVEEYVRRHTDGQ